MAEAHILEDQLKCPVCLDLLKDPVMIPCGHNYCNGCILGKWNQEDRTGIYQCTLCQRTFTPRPVLNKNMVVAEMVEMLKKMRLQASPVYSPASVPFPAPAVVSFSVPVPPPAPAVRHTGPGDVQCTSCTGIKQKAVKSCRECRNSYCQTHLEQHEDLFRGKGHTLVDATGRLRQMICPRHDKMLEMYCRTDQRCICTFCLVDEHKNHDTVSTAAARSEKQAHLKETKKKVNQRIQKTEKDLQELREAVETHKRSAQTAVEDSERIFTELIRSIEKRRSEVKQLIRDQERAAVSQAEIKLERLKQELEELKRKDTELKQLSDTDDHIHFLQSLQSISLSGSTDGLTVSSCLTFDNAMKSISELRDKLQQFSREAIENVSGKVKSIQVILTPEYDTRQEFLQYSHQLTLDANTAQLCLQLLEGNTVVTYSDKYYNYPYHPERFDYAQVLCRESVTGRCYWEVEHSGSAGVYISLAYKSIKRKGRGMECAFGCNNQSWTLFCSPSKCLFSHNNINSNLPVASCSRIGVYVDYSAGILSFYSVSDTMSLIHRVQTKFTQPLYPGFGLGLFSTAKMCRLRN